MVFLGAAVLLSLVIMTSVILANSPGKLPLFLDEKGEKLSGSISEKEFVTIGGVEQGMFIRGENIENPVLLFVHGGPCFSEYFLVEKYPTGLEEAFTVCYWEERGGGLSYNADLSPESMTMEQLASDTIEVTNYLRERFGKDKIYLAAHSGGTFFALQVAAERPELYEAYIGIAQITNQAESEKLAYAYLLEQYELQGNERMVEKLLKYPVMEDETYVKPFFKSLVRDQAMHQLGVGTMRNMKSVERDVMVTTLMSQAYTFKEKINLWVSKFSFIKKTQLADEVIDTDLTMKVTKLEIPVYFFSGVYDLTVNHDLSKAYLHQLEAPVKEFYSFENAAHSPNFEEPEKMMEIIRRDILNI